MPDGNDETTIDVVTRASEALHDIARTAERELRFASPYLSAGTAGELIAHLARRGVRVRFVTALRESSVRASVLSLTGLRTLLDSGVELRSLPNLHAKVVVGDEADALVGSGNLTAAGLGLRTGHNIELGVRLRGHEAGLVSAEFDRWWDSATSVDAAAIERFAAFEPANTQAEASTELIIGVPLYDLPAVGGGFVEGVESDGGPALLADDLWLKPMYADDRLGEWWRDQTWMSTSHRRNADGDAIRRPAFEVGHRLVVYVSGSHRCPAIYEVRSTPEFVEPEPEHPDFEQLQRWGWKFDVAPVASCAMDEAPTLEQLGIHHASVRQQSHIRISRASYEAALVAMTAPSAASGALEVHPSAPVAAAGQSGQLRETMVDQILLNGKRPNRRHRQDCQHAELDAIWRDATAEEMRLIPACADCARLDAEPA